MPKHKFIIFVKNHANELILLKINDDIGRFYE